MLAFAVQCSPNYAGRLAILTASVRRFHPDSPLVVYGYDGYGGGGSVDLVARGPSADIANDRAFVIRNMLERFDRVCFLGADTELFGPLAEADALMDSVDFAMCPHVAGQSVQCNADFQLWRGSPVTSRILDWLDANIKAYPDEQRCLSRVPFAFPRAVVWHQRTHNVAYYNVRQYELTEAPDGWRTSGGLLKVFHYSAFDPARPEILSRHHRGPAATGDVLRFYRRYADMLTAAEG